MGFQTGPDNPNRPRGILATAVLLAILAALSLFIGVTMASADELDVRVNVPLQTMDEARDYEPTVIEIIETVTTDDVAVNAACDDAAECKDFVRKACRQNGERPQAWGMYSVALTQLTCVGYCSGGVQVESTCLIKTIWTSVE